MNRKQTAKRILTFTVAALFAGAVAIAQQPGSQPGMPNQPGQQPGQPAQPGQPTMPGQTAPNSEAGVPGMQESMSRTFGDQVFLRDTLASSALEARMSLLAEQKSPSPDVKRYGQRMVLVHNQLEDQLKPIATQLGVSEKDKLSKKQEHQVDQLQSLSGPAFDRAYIETMVKDQKHDVKEFKTEQDSSQTSAIQQAARMDAPVYAQHLRALEQIAQAHNVTIAEKQ
ncbi:MAG: DUF4142 domain-containing protein [Terracidiphilus sp.]